MGNTADRTPVSVRVLVPDGGKLESPEGDDDDDESNQADDEQTDQEAGDGEEGAEGDEEEGEGEEAEGEEGEEAEGEDEGEEAEGEGEDEDEDEEMTREEEQREESSVEDGSRLLHLNLDGLFLDLLGLEVDLDEVTLDLTARTGDGNLLGNLLSAVSGLLDGAGLSSLLGGGDGDGLLSMPSMPSLPDMPDMPNPMARARELAGALADRVKELFSDAVNALPLKELFTQFLEELVSQLLNGGSDDDNDSDEAATA
jgi:hypothetical protein